MVFDGFQELFEFFVFFCVFFDSQRVEDEVVRDGEQLWGFDGVFRGSEVFLVDYVVFFVYGGGYFDIVEGDIVEVGLGRKILYWEGYGGFLFVQFLSL